MQDQLLGGATEEHLGRGGGWGVLDGTYDQIRQALIEPLAVALRQIPFPLSWSNHYQDSSSGIVSESLLDQLLRGPWIDGTTVEPELAGVPAGEVEQIGDDLPHALGLGVK